VVRSIVRYEDSFGNETLCDSGRKINITIESPTVTSSLLKDKKPKIDHGYYFLVHSQPSYIQP
jgi:hypothetical protein